MICSTMSSSQCALAGQYLQMLNLACVDIKREHKEFLVEKAETPTLAKLSAGERDPADHRCAGTGAPLEWGGAYFWRLYLGVRRREAGGLCLLGPRAARLLWRALFSEHKRADYQR